MSNPVLSETGPLSPAIPLTLEYFAQSTIAPFSTRGTISRLNQSAGQLEGPYSESGWMCYVPTPRDHDQVEFVSATHPRTGQVRKWRVIDTERYGGAWGGSVDTDTTSFQLREEEVIDPHVVIRVSPAFSFTDFQPQSFA